MHHRIQVNLPSLLHEQETACGFQQPKRKTEKTESRAQFGQDEKNTITWKLYGNYMLKEKQELSTNNREIKTEKTESRYKFGQDEKLYGKLYGNYMLKGKTRITMNYP